MSLRKHPNIASKWPKAHLITFPAEERQYPKNYSSDILPPLANSFMMNGKSGQAVSPNKQMGKLRSFSAVTLRQGERIITSKKQYL